SVVDESETAGYVLVGVSVFHIRHTVSRPAGVADSGLGLSGIIHDASQVGDPSLGFKERYPLFVGYGDSRRIITAVFQLFQPSQQNFLGIQFTDIAYNSAHIQFLQLSVKVK